MGARRTNPSAFSRIRCPRTALLVVSVIPREEAFSSHLAKALRAGVRWTRGFLSRLNVLRGCQDGRFPPTLSNVISAERIPLAGALWVSLLLSSTPSQEPLDSELRSSLERFCVKCHGGTYPKGSINLSGEFSAEDIRNDPGRFRRVLAQLEAKTMPPDGAPQPSEEEREALIRQVTQKLASSRSLEHEERPRTTLRRLARPELQRTLRDLVGLSLSLEHSLPVDEIAHGFDNLGDAQFSTPLYVEQSLQLAAEASTRVLGDRDLRARLLKDLGQEGPSADRVRRFLEAFLRRAFRRPAGSEEIEARVGLFTDAVLHGASFEEGLHRVLVSTLASPAFLYRVEEESQDHVLSAHELAVRLSYLLWSSMPDERLFRRADEGTLLDKTVLAAEFDRLLADPKAMSFAERFGGQWLRFGELSTYAVDFRRHPGFNEGLRQSMFDESLHSFDALVRGNLPIRELVDPDWTFLDPVLAQHYGLDPPKSPGMQRTTLPDRRRGGVLSQASILTVTSLPVRTSVVLRGVYVLESLLGDPTGPPPPEAGMLKDGGDKEAPATQRERLLEHVRRPSCAACHRKIDPLGFPLESYDGIGAWRELPAGDFSSELPDGRRVEGPVELKAALSLNPRALALRYLDALLVYALGRPKTPGDEARLRDIVDQAAPDGYRVGTLLRNFVLSDLFRERNPIHEVPK